jgi:hypothetical protein
MYLKLAVTLAGCGAIKGYESRKRGLTRHGGGVWLASEIDGRHTTKPSDGFDSIPRCRDASTFSGGKKHREEQSCRWTYIYILLCLFVHMSHYHEGVPWT